MISRRDRVSSGCCATSARTALTWGIVRCQGEDLRGLDIAFEDDRFGRLRHEQRERHFRGFRIIALVDMRSMTLHGETAGALARQARDVAREAELDRVHDAALAGAVRSRNDEAPPGRRDLERPDPAQLPDVDRFDLDHGAPPVWSFASMATTSSAFSFFAEASTLRSASTVPWSIERGLGQLRAERVEDVLLDRWHHRTTPFSLSAFVHPQSSHGAEGKARIMQARC